MDIIIDFIKAVVFGIIEGITEWLPVSSTGHMIILEEFFSLKKTQGEAFFEFFLVIIQLAAILAVILNFFQDLWPFSPKHSKKQKKMIWMNLIKYKMKHILFVELMGVKRSLLQRKIMKIIMKHFIADKSKFFVCVFLRHSFFLSSSSENQYQYEQNQQYCAGCD